MDGAISPRVLTNMAFIPMGAQIRLPTYPMPDCGFPVGQLLLIPPGDSFRYLPTIHAYQLYFPYGPNAIIQEWLHLTEWNMATIISGSHTGITHSSYR